MRQLSVTLTILSLCLCPVLASVPMANLLQDTLDRIEENSRKPNPLYADLTRSYARPVSPTGPNYYDPILFDRIAWMEYLAHVSVEAELAGIAHALMGQMVHAVTDVPAMQPAVQAAVEGIRIRLGERQTLPNVPISKPFAPPKHLPPLPHHPSPRTSPFHVPSSLPKPSPALHHPSRHPVHHATHHPHKRRHHHRFGLLKAIGHAVKHLVGHGGSNAHHPRMGAKSNFARDHPIAAAIAQAVTSPSSHQPMHPMHPMHSMQPHKDIRQIAMEAAKDALSHLLPSASMEALPDLLGQILHALLARQIDRARSILQASLASHQHGEVASKLRMLLDMVHFDQKHYGTCMPLWDADWQLSWSDKARILELTRRSSIASSSMEVSSLPHAESIRGRMLLALNQRDASLRVIEHGIMNPLEHSLMLACWQQKFSQRGLEDALPTYEMALENHYGKNALVRRQHLGGMDPRKRDWIERVVRDVNEGIASGRYDQPVHVGPFSMIYPPHAAIRPSDQDTARARYLKGALENDLALKRIRELVDVGEHVDLSGVEQAANARIFQMQHRLHDLARRDEMAKKINLRLGSEEERANRIERERLERQMRRAIIGEQQTKADANAKQKRQIEVDAALARYNAEMSRLHDKYRRRYEGLMQAVEQGRVMPEQRHSLHKQMRAEQQAEADTIKARYQNSVQAAARKYAEHMARMRRVIEQEARAQARQKASLQPKHMKRHRPASQTGQFMARHAQPAADPYQPQSNYDPLTQQAYSSPSDPSSSQYAASPPDQYYADTAPTGAPSDKADVADSENYSYLY